MDIEALNDLVVGFLRDNLTDPTSNERNNWIYYGYPRSDLSTVSFPRVSVVEVGTGSTPVGINEMGIDSKKGLHFTATYDIDVWVKKGNVFTLESKVKGGSRLRDFLVDFIIQLFMDQKASYWLPLGIYDIEILGVDTEPFMDENELFRKTLSLLFSYTRDQT